MSNTVDWEEDGSVAIEPYVPSRRLRTAIGGIILVGSEIDHLVSLTLFKLTKLDPEYGFCLFDRTSLGTKLTKLRFFIKLTQKPEVSELFAGIDRILAKFSAVRNALAHGVILGFAEECILISITADYRDVEGQLQNGVCRFTERDIYESVRYGRMIADFFREIFAVAPFHETHDYKVLKPQARDQKSRRRNDPSISQPPLPPSQA